jgi:hypothetical protein
MGAPDRRRITAFVVFAGALLGYFAYFGTSDDHFDRLARARQIAMYGDVPFRDFFDPGYFLTLYASAGLEQLLGDNLLGEAILDCTAMAAGTTFVFLLASRASRSTAWGLVAAALTLLTEPRAYDFDKVLFYPLGLWACWRYVDRPVTSRLVAIGAVVAVAGLFRYDSAVYLGAASAATLLITHFGEWRVTIRRAGAFALVVLIVASPALIFIQATAGLADAFAQVTTYARVEGDRTVVFRPTTFDVDWSLPLVGVAPSQGESDIWQKASWFPGFAREANAAAWLYWLGVGMPLAVALIVPLSRANRERSPLARIAGYVVLAEIAAQFILRDPVLARIGGVMPLIVVGAGFLVHEAARSLRAAGSSQGAYLARAGALMAGALVTAVLTAASIWSQIWIPPLDNLNFARRLSQLAQVPPNVDLMPKGAREPLATYIRACTTAADRFFVPWFAADLYFFSGRGFAAGLPVVFGTHWSAPHYQQRSLAMFERQSVPIVLTTDDDFGPSIPLLAKYVKTHYDVARQTAIGPSPEVKIWVKRGLPVTRLYGPLALPCFAPR